MSNSLNDAGVAAVVERLFPALERVWAAEVGPQAEEEADRCASEALKAVWDEVIEGIFGALDAALTSLKAAGLPNAHDPLRSKMSLLGPLGLERHEPTHTQALRFLFDPDESHGLNRMAIHALLNAIKMRHPTAEQLMVAAESAKTVKVEAERITYLPEEDEGRARNPRTDLWLELSGASSEGVLLVVENKVDDVVREGQLEAYEEAITLRLARLGAGWTALRILLSPGGECEGGWLGLSFVDLAASLAAGLPGSGTNGESFLRLYVASILRGVYRIEWRESPDRSEQVLLVRYLEVQREVAR